MDEEPKKNTLFEKLDGFFTLLSIAIKVLAVTAILIRALFIEDQFIDVLAVGIVLGIAGYLKTSLEIKSLTDKIKTRKECSISEGTDDEQSKNN